MPRKVTSKVKVSLDYIKMSSDFLCLAITKLKFNMGDSLFCSTDIVYLLTDISVFPDKLIKNIECELLANNMKI